MQIIEAALAFAVTMLVLSLICSSFVEIVHRTCSLREAGLKYMLDQIFDRVLTKYISPVIEHAVKANPGLGEANKLLASTRAAFVERMSTNRAPAKWTAQPGADNKPPQVSLPSMTAAQFMERLGSLKLDLDKPDSLDVAEIIKKVNETANAAAAQAGETAADAIDAVLKDIAQKFEAFGNDVSEIFQGRARWISVGIAILLAFGLRVDPIGLFATYMHDPSARNAVIEQAQAATAQYKSARETSEALEKAASANPPASDDVKQQIAKLQKDWKELIEKTRNTEKQYSDLGLPIGWTKQNFPADPPAFAGLVASLLFGGVLIGLGSPFWANAVTGLTNIRDIVKDIRGAGQNAAGGTQAGVTQPAGSAQPATPVGAFTVAEGASAAAKPRARAG